MKKLFLLFLFLSFLSSIAVSKENIPGVKKVKSNTIVRKLAAGCAPSTAAVNLDINNVRARIMNGGDMWWDLVGEAKYEVPKVTEAGEERKTALFAGALWIGGYDNGNNLRAAAMTYRQQSSWDFFPGPLDTTNATIDESECIKWDKIFQLNREEIDEFIKNPKVLPDNIRDWPAHGDQSKGQAKYLAPFIDGDNNGLYEPELIGSGDYPDVYGDQTLWFVYNDRGNNHTETQALAIGLEIQTQAFAFATNDEINNMTFYQQKIINRSGNTLSKVYFGQWVDPDLGFAYDDYVGCDTTRSLGICYNGDDFDEGVMGYGSNPPSIGIDFFQGPLADPMDGIDNDKDGEIDEPGEEIIMSKFVYYNNDYSLKGNPQEGIHYYYYLVGKFKNGQKMRSGGDGFNNIWENKEANYMFPADPTLPFPSWSEVTAGNTPADRRFVQSAGPFTLVPGAVNYITVGAIWARATSGGNTGSYDLLLMADDKAQKLYNNEFKLIDGPDAPDVVIQELDRNLVLSFENTIPIEKYEDTIISQDNKIIKYKFQGYQIFQLKDATVTSSELENPDKARLVARFDLIDGIKQLVNRQYIPGLGIVPTEKVDINGDNGIKHTFSISSDAFSSGDATLVNYRAYYFMVLSYAVADDPNEFEQYLAGRKNIKVYTGIPHKNDMELDGTKLGSKYGDGPILMRIEGVGNGGQMLEFTEETVNSFFPNKDAANNVNFIPHPSYKGGNGPVNIFVFDPLKVPNADFEIWLLDTLKSKSDPDPDNYEKLDGSAYWMVINKNTNDTIFSDTNYATDYEQILKDDTRNINWGLSIKVDKVIGPSIDTVSESEGLIEATLEFKDISKRWFVGIGDADKTYDYPWPYNWIRSGKYNQKNQPDLDDATVNGNFVDPKEVYEGLVNGLVAPYGITARSNYRDGYFTFGPAYERSQYRDNNIDNIASVDLVFTSDRSKWTRCIVLEMGEDDNLNEGKAEKHFLREHLSWNDPYDIDSDGKPIYNKNGSGEIGRSWFPGYALNLETGERLNIIFGEDSYFEEDNGRDMIWNPSNSQSNPAAFNTEIDRHIWGGKHHIFIMASNTHSYNNQLENFDYFSAYDGGQKYLDFFNSGSTGTTPPRKFWSAAMYVVMGPISLGNMLSLKDGLIPTETKLRIRIEKPYTTYNTAQGGTLENYSQPYYKFSSEEIALVNSEELGRNAMELINIVPNPYYGFSYYEKSQLDNRVRITNLPKKCDIYIYNLNGNLVRKVRKDETDKTHQTYWDWDLQNHAGVPLASGLYIIHVDGYKLGTKTLKWFGIMRPQDMETLF